MAFVHFSMVNLASWSEIVFSFEPTPGIMLKALSSPADGPHRRLLPGRPRRAHVAPQGDPRVGDTPMRLETALIHAGEQHPASRAPSRCPSSSRRRSSSTARGELPRRPLHPAQQHAEPRRAPRQLAALEGGRGGPRHRERHGGDLGEPPLAAQAGRPRARASHALRGHARPRDEGPAPARHRAHVRRRRRPGRWARPSAPPRAPSTSRR